MKMIYSWMSYVGSQDDSGVELQRRFVLLVDLLLSLRADFTFGLSNKAEKQVSYTLINTI